MNNVAIRTLSLCSGIGGLDLGVKLALGGRCETVCYVEREGYCAAVLVGRMEEAALDPAPIWDDLSTFDGRPWRGRVDLITGGYPCQPFSLAGARRGEQDERHLWPHVRRIVAEVQPVAVFFENVAGHVSLGLEGVVRDLEGMGYRVASTLVTASEVGAPHKRERVFILGQLFYADRDELRCESGRGSGPGGPSAAAAGDTREGQADADGERRDGERVQLQSGESREAVPQAPGCGREVGNAHFSGLEGRQFTVGGRAYELPAWPPSPSNDEGWRRVPEEAQPAVRRVADGTPLRVDRLRALGNGVVPQQAALAFRILVEALA